MERLERNPTPPRTQLYGASAKSSKPLRSDGRRAWPCIEAEEAGRLLRSTNGYSDRYGRALLPNGAQTPLVCCNHDSYTRVRETMAIAGGAENQSGVDRFVRATSVTGAIVAHWEKSASADPSPNPHCVTKAKSCTEARNGWRLDIPLCANEHRSLVGWPFAYLETHTVRRARSPQDWAQPHQHGPGRTSWARSPIPGPPCRSGSCRWRAGSGRCHRRRPPAFAERRGNRASARLCARHWTTPGTKLWRARSSPAVRLRSWNGCRSAS